METLPSIKASASNMINAFPVIPGHTYAFLFFTLGKYSGMVECDLHKKKHNSSCNTLVIISLDMNNEVLVIPGHTFAFLFFALGK